GRRARQADGRVGRDGARGGRRARLGPRADRAGPPPRGPRRGEALVRRARRAGAWGETELVVVGAPGRGPAPTARAHSLGLDGAVRFVGAAPDADLPAVYGG